MHKMSSVENDLSADVCVVGAGMVGLAHALEARRRGLRVVVLDRDSTAVGASVRNFGHLFFGSQPDGPVFDLALRSRERWLELAPRAGIDLVQEGTLIIARAEDELAVLDTALANPARRARMLTAAQTLELAPLGALGILGALHSPMDLRVSPRLAVAGLAALLEADADATLLWNTRVHAVEPGVVHATGTGTGSGSGRGGAPTTVRAPRIIVCPGPDFRSLAPGLAPGLEDLTRCRLQMLRVASPAGRRFGPALATGLSLIRYPAFADQAPTGALRARLARERPELLERGIHLLITQLPGGDLIIGDSHTYGDTLDPFADERTCELLLGEAAGLLGVGDLAVRERWLGIYASRTRATPTYEPFHVSAPMDGVSVVENVAGIGMTLSLGFAADVLDAAAQPVAAPS
jgi:FAD dependent oxidoreductase TIGR03364